MFYLYPLCAHYHFLFAGLGKYLHTRTRFCNILSFFTGLNAFAQIWGASAELEGVGFQPGVAAVSAVEAASAIVVRGVAKSISN